MKNILLIATGGTIASRERENGLAPVLSGEEVLAFLPQIASLCHVDVENPFHVDSTDITTDHRRQLAHMIWDSRDRYDGFVVTHGTDTLAYTAALLYHMLPHFDKPVAVTGSQRPIGEKADAERNLLDAFRVACAGKSGVTAVAHQQMIRGDHVVKARAQAMDAFHSVSGSLVGTIRDDGKVLITNAPTTEHSPYFAEARDSNILVLRLVPDLDESVFSLLQNYGHVILEAYGSGGIPAHLEDGVRTLITSGTKVYIASQCLEGEVNLQKYAVGRRAQALGAVSLGRRTIESTVAEIQCGVL